MSTNTTTTKPTNLYGRSVMGKCFKCGVPGHRSNDYTTTRGKVNLTLTDDEFDKGGDKNNNDDDISAEICHHEGGEYATK
ncbi:bZIP transcription factor 60 [Tanacetum coccineum]